MREQQNPSTPELHQPLLFLPSELLACGTCITIPSVGNARRTAWEQPLVEWARTANSYCSIVLDCDSRESQELACAVEVGYGDLPQPNAASLIPLSAISPQVRSTTVSRWCIRQHNEPRNPP